ncbi:uroporphyrinogen-III synthase [Neorickettsia risticii]
MWDQGSVVAMILITRPVEDAIYLQERLQGLKIESLVEPLFVLQPLCFDVATLVAAKVIVSSKNAIRALTWSKASKDLQLYAMSDNIAKFAISSGFSNVLSCGCSTAKELEAYVLSYFGKDERVIYLSGAEITRDIVSRCSEKGFRWVERRICYMMCPLKEFSNNVYVALRRKRISGVTLFSVQAAVLCKSLFLDHGITPNFFSYFVMSHRIASTLDCDTVYVSSVPTLDALVDVIERHYYVGQRA